MERVTSWLAANSAQRGSSCDGREYGLNNLRCSGRDMNVKLISVRSIRAAAITFSSRMSFLCRVHGEQPGISNDAEFCTRRHAR